MNLKKAIAIASAATLAVLGVAAGSAFAASHRAGAGTAAVHSHRGHPQSLLRKIHVAAAHDDVQTQQHVRRLAGVRRSELGRLDGRQLDGLDSGSSEDQNSNEGDDDSQEESDDQGEGDQQESSDEGSSDQSNQSSDDEGDQGSDD